MGVYQTLWNKQKVSAINIIRFFKNIIIVYLDTYQLCVFQQGNGLCTAMRPNVGHKPNYKTFITNLFCMSWTALKI